MKRATEPQLSYIASLRLGLGIVSDSVPATSREASALICSLEERKAMTKRTGRRQMAGAEPPSLEVRESITRVAARLGVDVAVPAKAADARFVLDDLYHRERRARRSADGSAG